MYTLYVLHINPTLSAIFMIYACKWQLQTNLFLQNEQKIYDLSYIHKQIYVRSYENCIQLVKMAFCLRKNFTMSFGAFVYATYLSTSKNDACLC